MKLLQFLIFSIFMSALLFATASAGTIYTWKDKDGVTHITKEPPPKNARQVDSMDYKPDASFISPPPQTDEATKQIGEHVAGLVEDGDTLELGIGRIPHAVVPHLRDKKDG